MTLVKKFRMAVDPGISGGIAWRAETQDGTVITDVSPMPETEKDMAIYIGRLAHRFKDCKDRMCHIEKVNAFPTAYPDKSFEHRMLVEKLDRFSQSGNIDSQYQYALEEGVKKLKNYNIVNRGAKSTWTFAMAYAQVRMCLICYNIPFDEITPKAWQKLVGHTGQKDYQKNKRALKAKAQQLYPRVKGVTLKTCDALLILHATHNISIQK